MTWKIGHPGTFGAHNANFITDDNNDAVAEVYGIPQHTTLEDAKLIERAREGLKNAHLISAAPELLEALQGLRAMIIGEFGISAYENINGERADSAIAKAKGEA